MSRAELDERAGALRRDRVPFVHARVVLAEKPTSAKPGDEALVLADGTLEGFVGGACAESTVRAQSLAVLEEGESRLVRITPVPEPGPPGTVTVTNPCLSGGALEIFLEPVMPPPLLVIHGEGPIARALMALAGPAGYDLAPWGGTAGAGAAAVVVASHGRDEEDVLAAVLAADVPYIGLVASRRRGEAVLRALDVDPGARARVHTPAGVDIGARTPQEVALSILAEIVATRPRPATPAISPPETATAVDPVCGMAVAAVDTSLHLDRDGVRHWFCGSGCRDAFADNPGNYTP